MSESQSDSLSIFLVLKVESIANRKEISIMNTENNIDSKEQKIQYILNENGELTEMLKSDAKPVEYPIKYKLKNAFEVFVRVEGTENYWISNYGRCVNNLNHKDKNTFYRHKEGKCHYTIHEIEKQIVSYPKLKKKKGIRKLNRKRECLVHVFEANTSDDECNRMIEELQNSDERRLYTLQVNRYKRETSPEGLVVDTFLVKYKNRSKVWHKDGNESNNWYKNLLMVSPQDYKNLKEGKITWQELNLEQEYIEYENKASCTAYKIYNGILARCKSTEATGYIHKCYNKSTMCQEWLDNPRSFVKWYLEHYYEVDGEEANVDKDLFGDGSGMYCPDFCCILPKGLNAMLANSKKHYKEGETPDDVLPLGVKYSGKTNKYHGKITFTDTKRAIQLSEWNTPEEAFEEYKIMKQADICMVAAKYKESIPDYIYDALLKVEVKPY